VTGGRLNGISNGFLHTWGKAMGKKKDVTGEKSIFRGLGFCSITADSNSVQVDCRNGKIVRIRPLRYDLKYPDITPWEITAKGKSFSPWP